ncbi:MAG: Rrf2 family transcriptional regulator [Dehalococcoidia bacterium]
MLNARRGASGGYMLARPATELTVGEVIRAVEGPRAGALRGRTAHDPCPRTAAPTRTRASCANSGSRCATPSPQSWIGRPSTRPCRAQS